MSNSQASQSVFRRKEVFSLSWIPDKIFHRDEQIDALKNLLQDTHRGIKPRNCLLIGDYGTGKTLVAKVITEKFEQEAQTTKIKTHYINCSDNDTHTQIIRGILYQVDSEKGRSGFPTDTYQLWLKEYADQQDYVFLLLDEVDKVIFNKEGSCERLFYFLTRSLENVSLIMLTNKMGLSTYLQDNLDSRVRDTLRYQIIPFPDYGMGELSQILKDRCELGLNLAAWNMDVVMKISEYSHQNGLRARGLVDVTRTAGELADRSGVNFLKEDLIIRALEQVVNTQGENILEGLDPAGRVILCIVWTAHSPIDADMIYDKWVSAITGKGIATSRRMFCHHIKHLVDLDLLLSIIRGKGRGQGLIQHLQLHPNTAEIVNRFFTTLEETPHPTITNVTVTAT